MGAPSLYLKSIFGLTQKEKPIYAPPKGIMTRKQVSPKISKFLIVAGNAGK